MSPWRGPNVVSLVEGSEPCLSGETQCILRRRLRAAALVLCGGVSAFLPWHIWNRLATEEVLPKSLDGALFGFHVIVAAVLGVCAGMLCRRCDMSLGILRKIELIVFGVPAAFFAAMQYITLSHAAAIETPRWESFGWWSMLIFTYAIFIPNSWRRAAIVVGLLGAMPIAVTLLAYAYWGQQLAAVFGPTESVKLFLGMAVTCVAAVYGTHMVGTYQRQAFEARQLGQYRLRKLIGAGGMGEVYLAEHQLMKRPCAIKVIRPGREADPTALARFEREVRATARLSHWNTVEVFDYGRTSDGTFFYVMEYLPGLSLAELVERHGPLPAERVIHLMRQTCHALREAHDVGLIHRDIKPGNIFAAQRGGVFDVAKLLDFGLAKATLGTTSSQLTQDGSLAGSPLYMTPEQATGDATPDARSDIYSLGAVMYFLLTGRPPFDDDLPMKVLMAHARDPALPPSKLQSDVPADLERIVLRCLEKRPEDRFQTVVELERELSDCEAADKWTRGDAQRWWRRLASPQPATTTVA